jgi:hypothetical protein
MTGKPIMKPSEIDPEGDQTMTKSEVVDRLYELQCKCYALADLFAGLKEAEDMGLHPDTPYGLRLILADIAGEMSRLHDEAAAEK